MERIISSGEAPRTRSIWVSVALGVMTSGVIFLSGVVAYALIVGDPQEERTAAGVEQLIQNGVESRNANACTGYQNHRAIEEALRDIARLNGIRSGDPRVLPSDETIRACKAVGIEIDEQGIPQVSHLSRDD